MNILIDGYNLLKQALGTKQISERQRNWFAQRAAEYANKKGHTLYIVYDAGPYTRLTKEKKGRVITVYSGHKDTADDIIMHYIEENLLKNLLVVTTDRQLNAYADQFGIPSIDSLDFYRCMKEEAPRIAGYKKVSGHAQKMRPGEGSSELDALMQEGSSVLQYKQEGEDEAPAYDTKGSSKKEKRLLAILKKL